MKRKGESLFCILHTDIQAVIAERNLLLDSQARNAYLPL